MAMHDDAPVDEAGHAMKPFTLIGLIGAAAIVIQLASGVALYFWLGSWSDRANFGEMFGFVNALFSGLALAGVIVTLLLQRHDLEEQKRETQRALQIQNESAQALAAQATASKATARLAALGSIPVVSCELRHGARLSLSIVNAGTIPAFDVEAWVVGRWHRRDGEVSSDEHKESAEDFAYQIDLLRYFVFTQRTKIIADLVMSTIHQEIFVLLQYRDIQASNHLHLYSYSATEPDGQPQYRLRMLEPRVPTVASRIVADTDLHQLGAEDGSPIPAYLSTYADHFKEAMLRYHKAEGAYPVPQDRGEWRDIS